MTLLAIDQGNSRTKFGLFSAGKLQLSWTIPTDKSASSEALAAGLSQQQLPSNISIGLCSVVPEALPQWQTMADAQRYTLQIISGSTPTPLQNVYATPETLGADRLMAAVAAAALVGKPVIPVSLGTAMVVDAVSGEGKYLGGMIAPGIDVIARALNSKASGLWQVEWREPTAAIGDNSHDAMRSGLFHQSLGGLREMIQAVRAELGEDAPLALTGGWANQLAPYLSNVALVDDSLILRGIAIILNG